VTIVRIQVQQRTFLEIDERLLEDVRRVAAEQGREEREVLEEAVRSYLGATSSTLLESVRQEQQRRQTRGFVSLLDRMGSRFALDEEEAMDLANAELREVRAERRSARAHEEGTQ
jgi:metal-responsive CopG/Arc/MetJ family transcriptional regulator